jgi:nucleotide-binding universal stress UspA family protein
MLGATGAGIAALLTTGASAIIFFERFFEGVWAYLFFIPALYVAFGYTRSRRGAPTPLDDHLGRFYTGQYLLPFQRYGRPEHETNFDRIAVVLDGSALAEHSLPIAESLNNKFGSVLELVSVNSASLGAAELDAYLSRIAWQLKLAGIPTKIFDGSGRGNATLLEFAHESDASLIILTERSNSAVQRWFRASPERVVPQAMTPLLVLRATDDWRSRGTQFQRLLVCLDGSERAEQALRYARALAKGFSSELLVLGVPEIESEEPRLREYLEKVVKALQTLGLDARRLVTGSTPGSTIVEVARERAADLILMASAGRGEAGRRASIGSVVEEIMQTTPCPLLIIPSELHHPTEPA